MVAATRTSVSDVIWQLWGAGIRPLPMLVASVTA